MTSTGLMVGILRPPTYRYMAIKSQPPGSIQGNLRLTEQGEMIQYKFGIAPAVAMRQLEIYTTATLLGTIQPPDTAREGSWRSIMDSLAKTSCSAYRKVRQGSSPLEWTFAVQMGSMNEPRDTAQMNLTLTHQAAFHQHFNRGSAIEPSIETLSRIHTRTARGVCFKGPLC